MSDKRSEAEEAVRESLNRWLDAFNRQDADCLLSQYDEEAVYANSGSPLMRGKGEIRPWFEAALGGTPMRVLFKEETIFVTSEMAFIGGKYHFRIQGSSGQWEGGEAGRVGLLFRRQADGRWLMLHDMDNNPPDALPADFPPGEG